MAADSLERSETLSFGQIADELNDVEQIMREIQGFKATLPKQAPEIVPPRTPMEALLVGLWSEVLGLEQVSIHHDFFELGGDSIRAVQVLSRVQEACAVELPIEMLFAKTTFTLAELAQEIDLYQITHAGPEALGELLAELAELSDEEAKALLAEETEAGE